LGVGVGVGVSVGVGVCLLLQWDGWQWQWRGRGWVVGERGEVLRAQCVLEHLRAASQRRAVRLLQLRLGIEVDLLAACERRVQ
jgi:hypothetical protein